MLFRSMTLASFVLLTTGCSQSLQGLVYNRGRVPSEFHYPQVQYGHIQSVTQLDAEGKEGSILTAANPVLTKPSEINIKNTHVSGPHISDSVKISPLTAQDSAELKPPSEAATDEPQHKEDTPPQHTIESHEELSSAHPVVIPAETPRLSPQEIAQKIRELGLYNFVCTDTKAGTECTAPTPPSTPASPSSFESSPSTLHKVRLKVRLDSGKDYWFNQNVTAAWIPQPADRVKVFFTEIPPNTPRALQVERAIKEPSAAEH